MRLSTWVLLAAASDPVEKDREEQITKRRTAMFRRTTLRAFVAAALFTGTASQAAAQTPASLEVGSRVRLEVTGVSPRPLIGTVVRADQTTIEIQGGDQAGPVVVRRDAITKLQVSLGRRSRARGAGIGALVGFGIGVIVALVDGDRDYSNERSCLPNEPFCYSTSNGPNVRTTYTAVDGWVIGSMFAPVGALIGAAVPPGEKWQAVSAGLRVGIASPHKRDVRVFWSLGF